MILVLVKLRFLVIVSKDTLSIQIPRWACLVICFVDLAHVESEVVRDLPVILRVVPRKIGKLVLQVLLHIFLGVLVVVQVSTLTFVITFMRKLSFLALLDFVHLGP